MNIDKQLQLSINKDLEILENQENFINYKNFIRSRKEEIIYILNDFDYNIIQANYNKTIDDNALKAVDFIIKRHVIKVIDNLYNETILSFKEKDDKVLYKELLTLLDRKEKFLKLFNKEKIKQKYLYK